jgi:hypothetical protein
MPKIIICKEKIKNISVSCLARFLGVSVLYLITGNWDSGDLNLDRKITIQEDY